MHLWLSQLLRCEVCRYYARRIAHPIPGIAVDIAVAVAVEFYITIAVAVAVAVDVQTYDVPGIAAFCIRLIVGVNQHATKIRG
jgi:hypothetical protein